VADDKKKTLVEEWNEGLSAESSYIAGFAWLADQQKAKEAAQQPPQPQPANK